MFPQLLLKCVLNSKNISLKILELIKRVIHKRRTGVPNNKVAEQGHLKQEMIILGVVKEQNDRSKDFVIAHSKSMLAVPRRNKSFQA